MFVLKDLLSIFKQKENSSMSNENQTQTISFSLAEPEKTCCKQSNCCSSTEAQSFRFPTSQQVVADELADLRRIMVDNSLGDVVLGDTTLKGAIRGIMDGIVMSNTMEELTREKAYLLWEAAGCPEGEADKFWIEAEKQVKCN